jgi:hypothetical protein
VEVEEVVVVTLVDVVVVTLVDVVVVTLVDVLVVTLVDVVVVTAMLVVVVGQMQVPVQARKAPPGLPSGQAMLPGGSHSSPGSTTLLPQKVMVVDVLVLLVLVVLVLVVDVVVGGGVELQRSRVGFSCVQVRMAVAQSSPTRSDCRMRMGGEVLIGMATAAVFGLFPEALSFILFSWKSNMPLRQPSAPGTSASLSRKVQRVRVARICSMKLPGGSVAV